MENTDYRSLAEFFKIFGDETRIRLLSFLAEEEKNVNDIASGLEMSSSAVSHQLNILRRSRLVKTRRDGRQIYYSLDDSHVHDILSCGKEHIEEN